MKDQDVLDKTFGDVEGYDDSHSKIFQYKVIVNIMWLL